MKLDFSLEGYEKTLKLLHPVTMKKVINATINDEGRRFVTEATKQVRATYMIGSRQVKERIKIKRSKTNKLEFNIHIESERLELAAFQARQYIVSTKRGKRKGVTVKVKRRGKRKVVKGGFMHGGHIFKRDHRAKYPIAVLTTLSVPEMFNRDVLNEAEVKVQKNVNRSFEKNLNFYVSRGR